MVVNDLHVITRIRTRKADSFIVDANAVAVSRLAEACTRHDFVGALLARPTHHA
jgi:hypothetical protein